MDWGDARPIETRYAGHRFRSRLEARWAVFFDRAGVAWQYENEGFDLEGVWYLPDFYLPRLEVWLEVKHRVYLWDADYVSIVDKAFGLFRHTGMPVLVAENIPLNQIEPRSRPWGFWGGSADPGDYQSFAWTSCLACGQTGLASEFGFDHGAPVGAVDPMLEVGLMPCRHAAYGTLPRLEESFAEARAARFERGR